MALALTLTVTPAGGTVTLRASGGVPPYTAFAYPAGDAPDYQVRTTWIRPTGAAADVRVGIDGQIPLNTSTAYQLRDSTGARVDVGPVTVHSDTPILSDATDPTRAMPVVVKSQPPNSWEARSVWWDVLGASAPFVSVAPMRYRNGDLVLRLQDRTIRANLITLLRPGNPLLLRAVCPDAVDDVTFLVTTARDELILESAPSGPRLAVLTYQAVSAELGPYATVPGRQYVDLLTESTTYSGLLVLYGTYADLLTGTPSFVTGPNVLTNPTFSAGGAGWGSFWTSNVTWNYASGTALGTATAAGAVAVLDGADASNAATVPGRSYRVSGRFRCTATAPGAVSLDLITNSGGNGAQYFEPGAVVTSVPLPAPSPVWQPFGVTITSPNPVADIFTVMWRAQLAAAGMVIEWDDLSVAVLL